MTRTKIQNSSLSFDGGSLSGFRNAIINGNFDIWQRGTSHSSNGIGSADRWRLSLSTTTGSLTRTTFTLGQTDVPGEPTYFAKVVINSVAGASNFGNLQQYIEDVRTFAGQQVTISFWAKADATRSMSVDFAQNFGTGGSPSASVTGIGATKVTLTTSWQKITVTANIPSIAGKTLGSDGNSFMTQRLWFDAGSSFNSATDSLGQQSGTFDIAQVQVEAGPVATPFERRPIGTELALCQRYYFKASGLLTRGFNYSSVTNDVFVSYQLPVTMRAAPTLSVTGDINDGASFTTWNTITSNSFTSIFLSKSGLTAGQYLDVAEITASAEL